MADPIPFPTPKRERQRKKAQAQQRKEQQQASLREQMRTTHAELIRMRSAPAWSALQQDQISAALRLHLAEIYPDRPWHFAPIIWLDGADQATQACTRAEIYQRIIGSCADAFGTCAAPGATEVGILIRGVSSMAHHESIRHVLPDACGSCAGQVASLTWNSAAWSCQTRNGSMVSIYGDRERCLRCQAHVELAQAMRAFMATNPSIDALRATIASIPKP